MIIVKEFSIVKLIVNWVCYEVVKILYNFLWFLFVKGFLWVFRIFFMLWLMLKLVLYICLVIRKRIVIVKWWCVVLVSYKFLVIGFNFLWKVKKFEYFD